MLSMFILSLFLWSNAHTNYSQTALTSILSEPAEISDSSVCDSAECLGAYTKRKVCPDGKVHPKRIGSLLKNPTRYRLRVSIIDYYANVLDLYFIKPGRTVRHAFNPGKAGGHFEAVIEAVNKDEKSSDAIVKGFYVNELSARCKRLQKIPVKAGQISKPPTDVGNFAGSWKCPVRGTLVLRQNGSRITGGTFSGTAGQHWANPNNGTVADGGSVEGNTASFRFDGNNNTYSLVKATLSSDASSFSGTWRWFSDSGSLKGSGSWSCNR